MARCVAFRTPGLIPLESFTTFGVNVKPATTSPFGYFGTGLKYAIAVLLRNGCRVVLWRGLTQHEFYVKKEDFRGKEFAFVRMRVRSSVLMPWKYNKLPFTTELGKNWELWQAFRELETNTRDEKGETHLLDSFEPVHHTAPTETQILVYSERFVDEFFDRDKHFLVGGKTVREDEAIQVIDRPSKHIYYRGVRVMDLKEEAQFTYNILSHVDLTEDRTVKYGFLIESLIADYIVASEDPDYLNKVTRTNRWEGRGLSFAYASATPSRTFGEYSGRYQNPTAKEYLRKKDPSVATTTTVMLVLPKPEITENELMDICRVVSETLGIARFEAKNAATDDIIVFDTEENWYPKPTTEPEELTF